MDRLLAWLNERPRIALAALCIYVPFIVLSHNLVQRQVRALRALVTRPVFNSLLLVVVVATLVVLTLVVVRAARGRPDADRRIRAWILTLAATAVSYLYLVVQFSESVHYPQYALLAVVLYALTRSYGDAFLWLTLISLVDEGYQFWYLRAHLPSYFDFNDTLMNQVGGLLGLALVYGASRSFAPLPRAPSWRAELRRSWALRISLALFAAALLLWGSGRLQPRPGEGADDAWVLLDRRNDRRSEFWQPGGRGADKPFHRVRVAEGVLLTVTLAGGMVAMAGPRRRHPST